MSCDTIVAVSSSAGSSWRGLLRLSGPEAVAAVASLVVASDSTDDTRAPALQPGKFMNGRLRRSGLPVLLLFFKGPRSFTGEDIVEVQMPGHPALLERSLLDAMRHDSVRLAEPGEFSYRAFTNRRIDLTRAEGIAATIAATNDAQLRAASQLRSGKLGDFAEQRVETLAQLLALVEAGIDFTDQEDVIPIRADALLPRVEAEREQLNDILAKCHSLGELEALPRVVLVGLPSAGKSTLFNALLGRERAVIDAMPGTTRDVLAEPWDVSSAGGERQQVMLVDVAGLSLDGTAVEKGRWSGVDAAAQAAAQREIERADVAVLLRDATSSDEQPDWNLPSHVKQIAVTSKADIHDASDCDLRISAITGQGLDALQARIWDALGDRVSSVSSESLALGPRHERCLSDAVAGLDEALMWIQPSVERGGGALDDVEMVAAGLRGALDALAALGGVISPDDVIGKVFATFCVGK